MSKLFFRYGAMNSGKSTAMLQVALFVIVRDLQHGGAFAAVHGAAAKKQLAHRNTSTSRVK